MESFYCVGLDVHKKTISYSVKTAAGEKIVAGSVAATRAAPTSWADRRRWRGRASWSLTCWRSIDRESRLRLGREQRERRTRLRAKSETSRPSVLTVLGLREGCKA